MFDLLIYILFDSRKSSVLYSVLEARTESISLSYSFSDDLVEMHIMLYRCVIFVFIIK